MSRRFAVGLFGFIVLSAALHARPGVPRNGPVTTIQTEHVTVVAGVSQDSVAPGERFSLVFDITPRRGVQVYAPGKHTYRVVRFALDAQSWLQPQPLSYPKAEIYHFAPLNEFVEVYPRAFTLVQDLTVIESPPATDSAQVRTSVTVSGRLEYQACDDKLCYMPKTVPVTWTIDWRDSR